MGISVLLLTILLNYTPPKPQLAGIRCYDYCIEYYIDNRKYKI